MTDTSLDSSVHSGPFNILLLLGAWMVEPIDRKRFLTYAVYRVVMTIVCIIACISLCVDFYYVIGEYKNMTWNMCLNTMFTGSVMKNMYMMHSSFNRITKLRHRLHQKEISRRSPEDEELNRSSEKELKFIRNFYYYMAFTFVPIWLFCWYFSTPRSIPVPLRIPFDYDLEDDLQYHLVFVSSGAAGILALAFILHNELCTFTIPIQISREYSRLLGDIKRLTELYGSDPTMSGEESKCKPEVNPWLRKGKTKRLLKEFSTFHQELIEYTIDLEKSFSSCIIFQLYIMVLLVTIIAMLCILDKDASTFDYVYRIGYCFFILLDMFLVCALCARLSVQCMKVGEEVYAAPWYKMNADVRRDLCVIIIRSQKPPKITAGKMMELNLRTYMLMLRNIYSCVALFQQLAFKSN